MFYVKIFIINIKCTAILLNNKNLVPFHGHLKLFFQEKSFIEKWEILINGGIGQFGNLHARTGSPV